MRYLLSDKCRVTLSPRLSHSSHAMLKSWKESEDDAAVFIHRVCQHGAVRVCSIFRTCIQGKGSGELGDFLRS